MARFLIGIDLGTTNSALAYVDLQRRGKEGRPGVETFALPQLVTPAELAPRPLLPSFLYLPGPHDLPAGATALPWDARRDFVVGEFARNQGGRSLIVAVPRLVCALYRDGQTGDWGAAELVLPRHGAWRNLFTDRLLVLRERVRVSELLADFPVCVLLSESSS